MKQATDEGPRQESGQDGVTIINPADKGNLREVEEGTGQSTTSKTMAPKPALYETGKGMDNDRDLIAAADEAHYARKDIHADAYDDASEAGHSSVVSHSDYSTTDGEESIASNSRKEKRSRRRRSSSRRRRSRSRSKDGRSKRSERKHREREEEEEEEETIGEEAPQEEVYDDYAEPGRSSIVSHTFQGTEEQGMAAATLKAGKAGDSTVKLLNFNTLYRAEQDRSPRYAEELEKITNNWNTCKTVLQRLLDEVKHANHLFHVSDVSFHQYSHVMYTIHKDIFLDDQGKRVLSSARQQLLLKQRGAGNVDGGRDELKDSAAASDGYLDPLYNSFSVLTDTMMKTVLDRESDNGKQAATIEFQEFCEELISQAEAMKALGDSVVQEMEGSEQDIQNAFVVLEQLASKVKTSKSSSVLDEDIKLGKPSKNFPKEMGYGGVNANSGDWWLWETLYRAAVKHQQVTWDANQERLEGLEDSLKYFQEKHQKKLEKAVLAVMPEQREMFLVGAKAFETALRKTDAFSEDFEVRASLDHEKMADEFEAGVQKRSASYMQKKTHHKSSILNRSRSKYNSAIEQAESMSATTGGDIKPLPAFGSPVLSKLVLQAKVLERWDKPGWLTTVAVFTVDRYLHLFDCSDLDTKTLPQTAFASMFPTSASTRTSVHHQGGGRRKASRATEHKIPTPSLSFNLVTCTLKTYGYARRSFEIKQVADPTNKNRDLPHTTLRFKDNPEAAEWYALLQDLPDYQGQDRHEEVQHEYDEEVIEEEAARQKDLYDDLEEDASREVDAESEEGDAEKFSEVTPEAIPQAKKTGVDDDGFEDAFEDASEYEATPARPADEANKETVMVETVDEDDDDSFHST